MTLPRCISTIEFIADDHNSELAANSRWKIISTFQASNDPPSELGFNEIVRRTGLTPRTVSKTTKWLLKVGAIERRIDSQYRALYKLTSPSPILFRHVARIKHRIQRRKIKDEHRSDMRVRPLLRARGRFSTAIASELNQVVPRIRVEPKVKIWDPPTFGDEFLRLREKELKSGEVSRRIREWKPSQSSYHENGPTLNVLPGSNLTEKDGKKLLRQVERNTFASIQPGTDMQTIIRVSSWLRELKVNPSQVCILKNGQSS